MFRLTADVKLNLCQNYLKKKISPSRKLIWHKDLRRHISCHFSPHATTSNQTRDATVKAARQGLILYEHQNKLIMQQWTKSTLIRSDWAEVNIVLKTKQMKTRKTKFVLWFVRRGFGSDLWSLLIKLQWLFTIRCSEFVFQHVTCDFP